MIWKKRAKLYTNQKYGRQKGGEKGGGIYAL